MAGTASHWFGRGVKPIAKSSSTAPKNHRLHGEMTVKPSLATQKIRVAIREENMNIKNCMKLAAVGFLAAFTMGCGNNGSTQPITNTQTATQQAAPAAVYTMTNDAASNAIREFRRNADGSLTFVKDYLTGASGSGDSLSGASGGLVFQAATNRFYAVNAGSNSVTMLILGVDGSLTPVSTVNSGGTRPISVTVFNDTVYVLNAGNAGTNTPANISGFQLVSNVLVPIPNSTQALSTANPNPAEIAFHPTGTVLLVTERGTNRITSFPLTNNVAGPGVTNTSNGTTPFGFDFTPGGVAVVSEASGGNVGAGTVSSYLVGVNGALTTVTNALATGQSAACWVEVARNAPYAYITNTASNNVSVLNVDASGALTLQGNGNGAATGVGPIDLEISDDNKFLYVLNGGDDSISAYSIAADGSLTAIAGGVNGLPVNSVGLVAR